MTSSSWYSSPSLDICADIALKWTPRMICAAVAGYYSLGIAYEKGVIASYRHFLPPQEISGAAVPGWKLPMDGK